jgi:hypothetical protein
LLLTALVRGAVMGIGYLLVIPEVLFALVWPVVSPVVVIERESALSAFRRSAALTRQHRWPIFWANLAMLVFAFLLAAALSLSLLRMGQINVPGAPGYATRLVATGVLQAVTSLIGSVWQAALYFELRTLKEGVAPDTLASVFD